LSLAVHPNVDKRSFIRWKQRDIHEKRAQRKQEIQNLRLSNKVNETLRAQVDEIISRLGTAPADVSDSNIAMAFKPDEAKLGPAPTGPEGPSYTQMLSSLFEEIRKAVKGDGKEAWLRELRSHRIKIGEEIAKNDAMVAKMEKEEKSKITSEGLHEGFSTSVTQPHLCVV